MKVPTTTGNGKQKTDENLAQIGAKSGQSGGQDFLRVGRVIDERNRNDGDRLREDQAGDGGQQNINRTPTDADHRADGEDAPAPAFFLRTRFGQRRRAFSGDRSERKRQALDVGGDAEQHVAQAPRSHAAKKLAEHQQVQWRAASRR